MDMGMAMGSMGLGIRRGRAHLLRECSGVLDDAVAHEQLASKHVHCAALRECNVGRFRRALIVTCDPFCDEHLDELRERDTAVSTRARWQHTTRQETSGVR